MTADHKTFTGGAAERARTARPRRRGLRAVLSLLAVAVLVLGAGFVAFVRNLPATEAAQAPKAEGIVVLTGAAARISDGLSLLASGQGGRLLISGVNPQTRSNEIAQLTPEHAHWFSCCVDLGRAAQNTVGNAVETRRWVRDRNFRSLIVVTSNFHMPRSMAEISHQLPDVTLVPHPVVSERVRVDAWWSNPASARLLFSEYLKYIFALARTRIAATLA